MLCQLSYRGRQPRDCSRASRAASRGRTEAAGGEAAVMRRFAVVGVAVFIGVLVFAPSGLAASARVAALQVGLRAHGFDPGPVDGVRGPLTTTGARSRSSAHEGLRATGLVGRGTRRALGGARSAAARSARARGRRGRLGRRGARVPAPALRARRARRRRKVHPRARRVALRRYQSRRGLVAGRDRRPEDLSRARWAQRDRHARPRGTSSGRERASSRSRRATT